MVKIGDNFKKIDRNDKRILSGELEITSSVKGMKIHTDEEKERRRKLMKENNPNAIIVEIFNDEHIKVFISSGNFENFLKDNNLPRTFADSHRKNGRPIGITPNAKTRLINQGYEKYLGWYAKKINK